MNKFITTALLLAMLPAGMSATDFIGYSDGTAGRSTLFRTSTDKTGLAVKIPAEKLKILAGKKITALEVAVGSKSTTEKKITMFVSESLTGEPDMSEVFDLNKANSWEMYEFAQPYTISGNEKELYIGYTMDIAKTYQALSADMSYPLRDVTFALYGDEWRDTYDIKVGQGNIRAHLDSDPEMTDMLIKPLRLNGYYKEGVAYSFGGELFNFGTKTIDSFSLTLNVGSEPAKTFDITESVAPGTSYKFSIPEYTANECGNLDVTIELTKVNGMSSDDDTSDNLDETKVFFYPSEMERAILIENFTGQACGNCPTGHQNLESVTETWSKNPENPELINVAHHSGYYPDSFTTEEDLEYTSLYNNPSTSAPAFMVNRYQCTGENAPVLSSYNSTVLASAIEEVAGTKPYVALSVESTYDPDTRKLDVNVKTRTLDEIPEERRTLNIMLCQDNIVAQQNGMGSNYVHHNAMRDALTESAWGVELPMKPGDIDEYSTSYTIPESYKSTSGREGIAAVPDDMFLVIFASAFNETDVTKRYVLNCVKVGLNDSKVQKGFDAEIGAIDTVVDDKPMIRVVDGSIVTDADCAGIEVYDMAGMRCADENLPAGLYIVRVVTKSGNVSSAKVLVR